MFGHLHLHTMYSTLDGMGKIDEIFQRAKELGQEFVAITDHGSTSALWEAQKASEKYGIKAILGTEFYIEREIDGKNGHLIALAMNEVGLRNIFKLQEYAYIKNFYKKPRIDFKTLCKHKEGLIILSACLANDISQFILDGQENVASSIADKYKREFGDNFYLEIQANTIPEQMVVNKAIMNIGNKLDIKVVATNDVHYVYKEDAFAQEVLLALQMNKKWNDPKRYKFSTNDFWLKSEEEMLSELKHHIGEREAVKALNITKEIADKCNAKIEIKNRLPKFYKTANDNQRELLVDLVKEGLKREDRKHLVNDKKFMAEVQNEIDVIDRNGYSDYFLIVSDYVTSARRNKVIVGDGRGSGAGSKVAWLTGITEIPPHEYDLIFERFLADGREPDIDSDFSDQETVFKDLQSKYGEENVARIVAFGTLTPKAVCRKVLSVFEIDKKDITEVSKLIPDLCESMQKAYDSNKLLLKYKEKYPEEFSIIERLEGVVSHESQHAGGVIIYPNLSSILPVKSNSEDRSVRIVGFDKYMLEELHHFKFDILGLTTLPIIKYTLDSIERVTGKQINLKEIDLEDKNIYEMLCKGDVSGVFQLSGQKDKVVKQQPKNFRDLIAINAIIRPGVADFDEYISRRKGSKWEIHPNRMRYMKETEGLIVYQEQYLLDANTFAGWDFAFADKNIRKNKKILQDEKLREKFINDSVERGYDKQEAEELWNEILSIVSQGYSFNKAHSASYAVLSYETAWLKYYYPEHFYSAIMTYEDSGTDGQSKIGKYITECRNNGISIIPPDINTSFDTFIAGDKTISYKLTSVNTVGDSAIKSIIGMRPIKSFDDFLERRVKKDVRANVIRNLIKAGCFDFEEPNRGKLMNKFDKIDRGKDFHKSEFNDKIKCQWEKESLGIYLSSNPLDKYSFEPLEDLQDNSIVVQGGEVISIKEFKDKNGGLMAFINFETLFGTIKLISFASVWEKNQSLRDIINSGNIIMVKGRKSNSDMFLESAEILS